MCKGYATELLGLNSNALWNDELNNIYNLNQEILRKKKWLE